MARPQATPKESSHKPPPPQKGKGKGLLTDSLSFANSPLLKAPSLAPYTNLHKLDLSNCGLRDISFVKEAKRTLTWLNLSGNKGLVWDGVEELSGLFVLNASHCGLERVPSHIESLRYLKALVLSHNKLTELDHIRRLPNLNTLGAASFSSSPSHLTTGVLNSLTHRPPVVSNNLLTSLPTSLTTLPSLKKLSCAHNLLTSSSLPDLTPLTHLREIALNTNPSLTSLPNHFATWGKGEKGDGRGLEILDLGNCGIESWMEVRGLGGQRGLISLGLKGTVLEKEGAEDEGGLEGFRKKLLILLPSLRIISNVRFDPKFIELKQKRLDRAPEQKILDAGPMAWQQILADAAVARSSEDTAEEGEDRGEEKEGEEGRKKGKRDEKKVKELRRMRRLVEEKLRERQVNRAKEDGGVTEEKVGKKGKDSTPIASTSSATLDADATATELLPKSEKKKKKKNRHEARESATSAEPTEEDSSASHDPLQSDTAAATETPKKKKRGRRSKTSSDATPTSTSTDDAPTQIDDEPPRKRKKKNPDGVLSALRGDGTEQAKEKEVLKPATPAPVVEPSKEKEKERSSVVKVVEVKGKEEKVGKEDGSDLEKLLGLWSGGKNGVDETTEMGTGWD